jgi:hypothetical protein
MLYFRTRVAIAPAFDGSRKNPGLSLERESQLSRIPFFNSQTRNAARINLFVRAIVPIPGSRGSSDDATISRRAFGGERRFGSIFGGRGRNVARPPRTLLLEEG